MKITCLGHAGLFVETHHGSILCDPWFGPAFYGSWFPFPDNGWLRDLDKFKEPTYLYVSHSHADHFDRAFCDEVDKDTIVVLPDYPIDELEAEMRALGFHMFIHTTDGEPVWIDDLRLTVFSNSSPSDGPMGDSAIAIHDGFVNVFNQNDSRPHDLDAVKAAGPYDVHFLQHSGAVWFPMVYELPDQVKRIQGQRKRKNQLDRFMHYVTTVDAELVVPNSGPPCFLDPEQMHLNDLGKDPSNIFPDQRLALRELAHNPYGRHSGQLLLPGSTLEPDGMGVFTVEHPDVEDPFVNKPAYLEEYAAREKHRANVGTLPVSPFLAEDLDSLFTPLVKATDKIADGINGLVVIDWGPGALALDFLAKEVRWWHGEEDYVLKLTIDRRILADLLERKVENWVDDFWPSMRFSAHRRGPYNDYVNSFFRCLTPERIKYAEAWYSQEGNLDTWTIDGWKVQRRCPHARADLARVGRIEHGVLTCTAHGLRFDLRSGLCLDSDLTIQSERVDGLR